MRQLGVPLASAHLLARRVVHPAAVVYEGGIGALAMVSGALAHVKGVYTEVLAAATRDYSWVTATVTGGSGASTTNTGSLMDIALGAAGAEVVIADNIACGYKATPYIIEFPLFIPKGARVAARMQRANNGTNLNVHFVFGYDQLTHLAPRHITNLAPNTALSRGVSLAAPAGASVESAWTQIVAATAEPYSALFMLEQGNSDTSLGSGGVDVDLAIGASGSESILVNNHALRQDTTETFAHRGHSSKIIQKHIPKGSRIAARYLTSDTSGSLDLSVYGIPVQ